MLNAAACEAVRRVENDGRVAPETPGPVLLNSAKKTSSVRGSPVFHMDQISLLSYEKLKFEIRLAGSLPRGMAGLLGHL